MFPRKLPSVSFVILLCPCSIQYCASWRLISATRPLRTNLMAVTTHSLAAHLSYVDLFAFVVDDGSIHSIGSHLLMLCINGHIPICLNATRLLQGFIIIIINIFIVFISVRTTFYWFACVLLWHWYWATLGLLILWERIWFFTSDVPQLVILVFSFVFLLVLPCWYPCLLLTSLRTGYEGEIRHNFSIRVHSIKWVPLVEAVSKLEVSTIWK